MNRRTLLKSGAVFGGLVGLGGAGYVVTTNDSGNDSDGGASTSPNSTHSSSPSTTTSGSQSDQATFADVQLERTWPSEDAPQASKPFNISVTVTNEGDQSATFTDTLVFTGPGDTQHTEQVEIADVPPGETVSTDVSVTLYDSGDYTVELNETNASIQMRLNSGINPDGAVQLHDNFKFTSTDATFGPALVLEGTGPYYLEGSVPHILPEDATEYGLAVWFGSVLNDGDEPAVFRVADAPFTFVSNGSSGEKPTLYTDLEQEIYPGIPVAAAGEYFDQPPLDGAEIPPGESRSGWLLSKFVYDDIGEAPIFLGVDYNPDDIDIDATWQMGRTGSGAPYHTFEVQSLDVPSSVTNGQTAQFSVTVTNVGDGPGPFRDVLEMSEGAEWTPVGKVTSDGDVPPGETRQLTGEFRVPFYANNGVRLQGRRTEPSARAKDEFAGTADRVVDGTAVTGGFGTDVTLPSGVRVVARQPLFNDDGFDFSDTTGVSNPVLLANVTAILPERVRGEGLGKKLLPHASDFKLNFSDQRNPYSDVRVDAPGIQETADTYNNRIVRPVRGELYPLEPPADPDGGSVSGWVALVNPQSVEGWPREEREAMLKMPMDREKDLPERFWMRWSKKFE